MTLDVHHPAPADVDPLGEGLGAQRGRVGSPSASGHHTREGGDCNDEHGHKLATAADGGRAHGGGRCWTCSHDSLIGEQSRAPGTARAELQYCNHGQCPKWVKSGRDALKLRCSLYPRKRTFAHAIGMSALGQKQTSRCFARSPDRRAPARKAEQPPQPAFTAFLISVLAHASSLDSTIN